MHSRTGVAISLTMVERLCALFFLNRPPIFPNTPRLFNGGYFSFFAGSRWFFFVALAVDLNGLH